MADLSLAQGQAGGAVPQILGVIYVWFQDLPGLQADSPLEVQAVWRNFEYHLLPEALPPDYRLMPRIIILDGDTLERIFELDQYESLRYTRRWQDLDDWELKLAARTEQGLRLRQLSVVPSVGQFAIEVLLDNVYEFGGWVDQCSIDISPGGNETATLRGNGFDRVLADRVVVPATGNEFDAYNDNAEDIMRSLVDRQIVNPVTSGIPGMNDAQRAVALVQSANNHAGDVVEFNGRFQRLHEALREISQSGGGDGLGFQINKSGSSLVFDVFAGVNRTAAVFSLNRDNIAALSIDFNGTNYATHLIMAGQGDGVARLTACAFITGKTALERREIFQDMRDLDSADKMQDRGRALLVDKGNQLMIRAARLPMSRPYYRIDFDLGDQVKVQHADYGIDQSLRIIEVEMMFAAGQPQNLILTFSKAKARIESVVRQASLQASSRN
jgi:hypothetical protein